MTRKYYRLTGEKYLSDDVYDEVVLLYSWSYDKCVAKGAHLNGEYINHYVEKIPNCGLAFFNWLKKTNPVGETAIDLGSCHDEYMSQGITWEEYIEETRDQ